MTNLLNLFSEMDFVYTIVAVKLLRSFAAIARDFEQHAVSHKPALQVAANR